MTKKEIVQIINEEARLLGFHSRGGVDYNKEYENISESEEDHSINYVNSRMPENKQLLGQRNTKAIFQIINAIKKIEDHLGIETGIEKAEDTITSSENNTDLYSD